jgi:hypothetical protein
MHAERPHHTEEIADEAAEGTASLDSVARWLTELVQVPSATIRAYVPRADRVGARDREQLILAVTEHHGSRITAWVHGAWLDFLGPRDPHEALGPLFAYARSCAEHGRPLDTTSLAAAYPASVVRSVRATVARAELEDLSARSLDDLTGQLRRRRPFSLRRLASDVAVVAGVAPLAAPLAVAAGAMWVVDQVAPGLPPVTTPPTAESNLVVDLVAEATPAFLGHALVRTGLVWAPVDLSIAFRLEDRAATLTVGRGRVHVADGIASNALVIVDGGFDALLPAAAGSIAGQLTTVS